MITSPVDLWCALCKSAGLELRLPSGRPGRDADVEDGLRLALGVPASAASLADWLAADAASSRPAVGTERLLVAVLESQDGYARMMRDILDLLVTAEARQASHTLSVEFKFDEVSSPIKATLEEFRATVNRIEHVLERRPILPNNNLMGVLSNSLYAFFSYQYTENFPPLAALTMTGHAKLDAHLATIAALASGFQALWKQHGATRPQVGHAGHATLGDPAAAVLRGQLYRATDCWELAVLSGAQTLAQQVVSGQMDPEAASELLSTALRDIEWGENWVAHTIQDLLDVLHLPAWQRRHELYSVWVGTRLLKVVAQCAPDMHFHPVDNVLSFAFGGSRLATFNWNNKQFDVWAELRSALVGTSAKRTTAIQPDFRILQPSLAQPADLQTTYVLECKHYLAASVSNFTQAAADYARSCPKALVHLVNHGPADDTVMRAKLAVALQTRTRFIGDATPLEEAASQALSTAMRDAVFPGWVPPPSRAQPAPAAPIRAGAAGYIALVWDASLEDMDLSLRILAPDGTRTQTVNFSEKGALDAPPFARLVEDVQGGPGEERIDIAAWHFNRYQIVATNYSKSGRMAPDTLHCHIVTDQGVTRLDCPEGLPAIRHEWKIAELSYEQGELTIDPID